jgi:hypothetical protein
MSYNLPSGKTFEETIETVFKYMGYNTKFNTVLHTRSAHIHAEIHCLRGKQKMLIECMGKSQEAVGINEVQKFCSKVAFARETSDVNSGLLVSNVGFTSEAVSWVEKHCSFVDLKTYKQLILSSARFGKMLRKFQKPDQKKEQETTSKNINQ